jgi:hypothetical protein
MGRGGGFALIETKKNEKSDLRVFRMSKVGYHTRAFQKI